MFNIHFAWGGVFVFFLIHTYPFLFLHTILLHVQHCIYFDRELAKNKHEQIKLRDSLVTFSPGNWNNCDQMKWAVKEGGCVYTQ